MSATRYPFQMVGGVPVVTAPAEIDITTAGQLRAVLFDWHSRGHATVVVDLTGTRFCDCAGLRELVLAHQRAVRTGGGLRLVIPDGGLVLRLFTVTGLDRLIPRFTTLEQALAQVPASPGRILRPDPHLGSADAMIGPPAQARERGGVADSISCERCGAEFVPQREHARFCSAGCRAAWNRESTGDPAAEASALAWSVTAMSEATAQLPGVKVWDRPRAFAAIGEAVWRITMVDVMLLRHHPGIYDAVMAAQDPAQRRLTDQTLAGLRFARNVIGREAGLDEVIETEMRTDNRRITGWMWKGVPEPALALLSPQGQAREMALYCAYQAHLAGHTIGQTLGRAVTFLTLTGANAASTTVSNAHSRRPPSGER